MCFFCKSLEVKLTFIVKSKDVDKNLVYVLSEIRKGKNAICKHQNYISARLICPLAENPDRNGVGDISFHC